MYRDKTDKDKTSEETSLCCSEERAVVRAVGFEEQEDKAEKRTKKLDGDGATLQFGLGVALVCAVSFLLLLYLFSAIAVGNGRALQTDENPKTSEQEWRGAFESREISEASICTSVGVRAGGAGEYGAPSASGFVIADGAWVATSSQLVKRAQRGRIYVIDSDGKEYPVSALMSDEARGVAFLRVESESLKRAASFGSDGLCVGEKLISVSSSGSPEYNAKLGVGSFGADACTVWLSDGTRRREGQIYTDMYFDGSTLGSPVFDSLGRIVAMALFEDSGYVTPIEQIAESFRALT